MIDFISTKDKTELLRLIKKMLSESPLALFKMLIEVKDINEDDLDDVTLNLVRDMSKAYVNKSLSPTKVRETILSFKTNHMKEILSLIHLHIYTCRSDTDKLSDLAAVVFYELCRAYLGKEFIEKLDLDYEYEERKESEEKPTTGEKGLQMDLYDFSATVGLKCEMEMFATALTYIGYLVNQAKSKLVEMQVLDKPKRYDYQPALNRLEDFISVLDDLSSEYYRKTNDVYCEIYEQYRVALKL